MQPVRQHFILGLALQITCALLQPGDLRATKGLVSNPNLSANLIRPRSLTKRPVPGRETSSFGTRHDPLDPSITRVHKGVDYRADYGTLVATSADGVVVRTSNLKGYGLVVYISHGNGLQTRYAHLQSIDVVLGQLVRAGDTLGEVGATGRATGPHLHFEVRVYGRPTNPAKLWLPAAGTKTQARLRAQR